MAAETRPSHLRDEKISTSSASSASSHNRDSNMVRASVLDVALQLGFGGPNSTVADWIFNNPLDEEEEPEEAPIPELTPSSATSEDSYSNGHTYPYTPPSAGAPSNQSYKQNIRAIAPFHYPDTLSSAGFKNQGSAGSSIEQYSNVTPSHSPLPTMPFSNFAPSIVDSSYSKQSTGTKLRKARVTGSGYESEGHISDGGRSRKEIEKIRKEIEAKTAKAAEKEAKAAAKEAKKEEKIKKSKSKREKKDRSKSPSNGDITDYETDVPSDGGYLSEAVSLSSTASYKKSKTSSKSSDPGKPKKSPSFFRRKAKQTVVVPPMPSIPFSTAASTSPPTSSGLGSDSAISLPPIAARFATTSATPPPTLAPSVSSLTLPPPTAHSSPLPSPSLGVRSKTPPVSSIPSPMHTSNSTTSSRNSEPSAPTDEVDDAQSTTASSRSSDVSMPASLPTSTSTSSHRKGFFKFGGSNENMKVKPTISFPLTRSLVAGSPTTRGASPMPGTPSSAPVSNNGFLAKKPVLEVRTHDFAKSASPREISPVQSASSHTSATHLPSALVQSSSVRVLSPIPAPASTFKKSRPAILDIQHPHEYNGSQTMEPSLPSPRRPNFVPVPPPTPPPTGPLPRVPPLTMKSGTIRGPPSAPPLVAPPPIPAVAPAPSPLQRGKEVPFPTTKREARPRKLDGMMDVPRYRGLPGFDNGHGANGNGDSRGAKVGRQQQPFSAFSTDSDEDEEEELDPEMLTNEFQRIRQRFYDHDRERASVPVTEPDRYNDSLAGDESFSYQHTDSIAFSADPEPSEEPDESTRKLSDDRSMYADDDKSAGRRTMYELEGRDSRHYDDEGRISRYSATQSVYSVMDDEKSGEARQRFLNRVAAMYGEGGREVPPVPKLPEGWIIKGTGVGRRRIDA